MRELLRIRDLSTDETDKAALNQFRLQVFSNEILGIVGLNGSGKNTLAEVLSGETSVKSGQIYFEDICLELEGQKISRLQLEKQGIFVIKNENRLIRNLSISENMSISLKRRVSDLLRNPRKREKLVELTLNEFFPDLNPDTDAFNLPLSVHWKIGVLKAYIEGARLIILDRIFEFCSEHERQELFHFIKILRDKGTSFIITYNKIASFLKAFDRLVVVRNGKLSGIIHHSEYNPKLLANLIIGKEFADKFSIKKGGEAIVGNKLLEVQDLNPLTSDANTSLTLHSGEILGLYDPVQEISATLINILSGNIPAEKNRILVEDRPVVISEEYHAIQSGIGIVSEKIFDKLFFKELTAGQNLSLSAAKRSAYWGGYTPSSAEKYLENKYLTEIGIPDEYTNIPVKLMDKDYQFILALHMRILRGAKIILLENPVRRADLLTRNMVYQRIESLREKGTGLIIVSTDITELDGFCDRIIQYDKVGVYVK